MSEATPARAAGYVRVSQERIARNGYGLEHLHVDRVGVRQDHHEEDDPAKNAINLCRRLAEVDLRFSGTMDERKEDLLPGALDGADLYLQMK